MEKNKILRRIPKIDEVLKEVEVLSNQYGRNLVANITRDTIANIRDEVKLLNDNEVPGFDLNKLSIENIIKEIKIQILNKKKNRLSKLINATGTILHTNLGRAPLCDDAIDNMLKIAADYSSLEYEVENGRRGSRHDILNGIICELTGAEDAMIVNNNASATMIVLATLGAEKEIIVSRGELVEIGGSFRIPEIMEQSKAKLIEVGATNKTKLSDYERAINEETAALMKVHTSNYKIMGFTADVSLEELVPLGSKYRIPVIYDMGSGLMVDLSSYGLDEPNVKKSLESGIDVILFSGDKLLGGPQAGIIAGKKKYIEKMKKHPLARALRVDKMTFAAMEETLKKYRDEEIAFRDIPVLKMITEDKETLRAESEILTKKIKAKNKNLVVEVMEIRDQIGGGSAPMFYIDGYGIAIESNKISTQKLERQLRCNEIPIIARIQNDKLIISPRTIRNEDFQIVADALAE